MGEFSTFAECDLKLTSSFCNQFKKVSNDDLVSELQSKFEFNKKQREETASGLALFIKNDFP